MQSVDSLGEILATLFSIRSQEHTAAWTELYMRITKRFLDGNPEHAVSVKACTGKHLLYLFSVATRKRQFALAKWLLPVCIESSVYSVLKQSIGATCSIGSRAEQRKTQVFISHLLAIKSVHDELADWQVSKKMLNDASRWGNIKTVQCLLGAGANPTGAHKEEAARGRNLPVIADMLEQASTLWMAQQQPRIALFGWRPDADIQYPPVLRGTTRTLLVLARAHHTPPEDKKGAPPVYPQACLELLPNEIIQYILWLANTMPHLTAQFCTRKSPLLL